MARWGLRLHCGGTGQMGREGGVGGYGRVGVGSGGAGLREGRGGWGAIIVGVARRDAGDPWTHPAAATHLTRPLTRATQLPFTPASLSCCASNGAKAVILVTREPACNAHTG